GAGWPQPVSGCCGGEPHCGQLLPVTAAVDPHVVHVIPGPLPRPAAGGAPGGTAVQQSNRCRWQGVQPGFSAMSPGAASAGQCLATVSRNAVSVTASTECRSSGTVRKSP